MSTRGQASPVLTGHGSTLHRRRSPWWVAALLCFALLVMTAALLLVGPFDEDAVRRLVRATARTSVLLFCTAFGASSLAEFRSSNATTWLVRHRRQVGVSFAFSHMLHLIALILLGRFFPDPFIPELNVVTIVGGGTGYLFVIAMAATSNDAAVRAFGARRWRMLHLTGSWFLWVIFVQSYIPRAVLDPWYVPPAALLLAAAVLRGAAARRRRRAP